MSQAAAFGLDAMASSSYDLPEQQEVRYTYWPVNYFLGDPTVISSAPLPLSGVNFSVLMKGVGELRASLQLADELVRSMNPWELAVPRKTGLVAVRSVRLDDDEDTEEHEIVWHGLLWERTPVPSTGRWEMVFRTIEYNWARRLITGPMAGGDLVWAQGDRTTIVRDLLTPPTFSQVGPPDDLGSATAAANATNATSLITTTAEAAAVTTGTYVQVTATDGTPRVTATGDTVFRVTSKQANTPIVGQVTINLTPAMTVNSLTGDLLTVVALFPGWVNIDKPIVLTGRRHDHSYKRDQQTNLLTAHQDRSKVDDGYDWYTSTRVLSGGNALDAATYRPQFVMGYPRLGREYGVDDIPRFVFRSDGRGNVLTASPVYNGSNVANVVWGQGAGYESDALRQVAMYPEDWANGHMITEDRYSNPDVKRADTLLEYTVAQLVETYANEQFVSSVEVRGDHPPYFGSYAMGDDALYSTDDWTNPDGPNGDRDTTMITRIMGWVVTPPEGTNAETVKLVLAGGQVTDGG